MSALLFFTLTFVAVFLCVKLSTKASGLLTSTGEHLQHKAFPSHSDFEYKKFPILRIILGLILISRSAEIQILLTSSEQLTPIGIISLSYLIATILLTIGLFTQYVFIFLITFIWQSGDTLLGTSTLGNDIGAMLAMMLFLTGSGKYISLDSIILRKSPKLSLFLLYSKGDVSANTIALVKLAALASYWAVCVYSLSMHLNEPAWMSGTAGPLLLSNNFMSSWHVFFSTLFHASELSVHLARYSMWVMMLWYPAVLPFVLLGGVWRKYVIIWGLMFFTLSLTVLNLGSLAEIEFVLWAALFWTKTGLSNNDKIKIFYDDKCNLCDKTIRYICLLDIFSRVKLKPVSENHKTLKQLNIPVEKALSDLHAIDNKDNSITFGYDFYLLLSRKIVLLWPTYPILLLGKHSQIGAIIYSYIAARRIKMFGVCTLPSYKNTAQIAPTTAAESTFQKAAVVHILFLITCYLISLPVPYMGIKGSYNLATVSAHYYGVAPINVFNKTDLRMTENWFTLVSIEYNELTPIFNQAGERLKLHSSDRVYFGHTLKIRRGTIGKEGCTLNDYKKQITYLSEVYLSHKKATSGTYSFKYKQYRQAVPDDANLEQGIYKANTTTTICASTFDVDYSS